MAGPIAGAIIGTGLNLISGGASSALNYHFGEKAAQAAYQRQLDFWNRQNEYNLPVNEVARLREAGLSPGAVLSGGVQGNVAGNLSTVPQNQSAGTMPAFDHMANVLNAMKLKSEIDLNNAQSNKMNTEAGIQSEQNPFQIDQMVANTRVADLLGNKYGLEAKSLELSNELAANLNPLTLIQAKQQIRENEKKFENWIWTVKQASLNYRFGKQTFDDRAKALNQAVLLNAGALTLQKVEYRAKEAGIDLTKAQKDEVAAKAKSALYEAYINEGRWNKYRDYGIDGPLWTSVPSVIGRVADWIGYDLLGNPRPGEYRTIGENPELVKSLRELRK